MRPIIFFFLFLLLSSSTYAFDCSCFENQSECNALNEYNESLIANLIYLNHSIPDHGFIKEYDGNIVLDSAPNDTAVLLSGNLKNVWFTFLYATPSVLYEDNLYVGSLFELHSEYDYDYTVPSTYKNNKKKEGATCKITYSHYSHSGSLKIYANGNYVSSQKNNYFSIANPTTFKGTFTASVTIQEKYYKWHHNDYGWHCNFEETKYHTDTLTAEDIIVLTPYNTHASPEFVVKHIESENYIGDINNTDNNIKIVFDKAYYQESFFEYEAVFTKEPYYFLTIKAINSSSKEYRNLYVNNKTLTVNNKENCTIEYSNFFDHKTKDCKYQVSNISLEPFRKEGFSGSWNFLLFLAIFVLILWVIYRAIKKKWGKTIISIVVLLALTVPGVHAEECGLTNLATCIPEKIYNFFINLLNAPLQPLLSFIQSLMTNPPSIDIFHGVWAITVYCISFFYGLLFMYAGFQFLFSGHNVVRREMAKQWLKNTVIMIVLVQSSFYLYKLVLELGSILTSSTLSLVNPQFFMLTADNLSNIGLEFIFVTFYAITLVITVILLLIRYLIVSFGIIFVPIGIFCYFVPPLKSYGKLILHMLGTFIFITFIYAIIILGCSMMVEQPIFANVKIMVMVACFTLINIIFIILTIKSIIKAAFSSGGGDDIAEAIKYIGMMG